jgi:drug/metabolite transporter (DMT)-like permease
MRDVTIVSAAETDRWAVFDGYARLYGPMAVITATLTFMPILDDVRVDPSDGSISRSFGTLWDMAAHPMGEMAVLGIMLALTLTLLLVIATFEPRSVGVPAGIAILAGLVVVMLIVRPDTGDPPADLSPAGVAGLVVAIGACVLGAVNAVHYGVWSRQKTGANDPAHTDVPNPEQPS